jgi:hypothetical protein
MTNLECIMRSRPAKVPEAIPPSRAIRNINSRTDDQRRSRVVTCRKRTAGKIAVVRNPG